MDRKFRVIIVEDVKLELKGTEEIFRNEIPEAEVMGTAMTEKDFWSLMEQGLPDMVLLDLGLGGSTTVGIDICKNIRKRYPKVKVLIFTGEILNEKLWVDALDAGASGIVLKTGELLTKTEVQSVMEGKQWVFNQPILEKIVARFRQAVLAEVRRQQSVIDYDIVRRASAPPPGSRLYQGDDYRIERYSLRREVPGEAPERFGQPALCTG